MRLRWKLNDRVTGLASICSGPRGSKLHDGETVYATIQAIRADGGYGLTTGWFWWARIGDELMNTCDHPVKTEKEAKEQAMKWVKEKLGW